MAKFEFPEKHPLAWTCLCIGTVSFPQWLSGVWAIFSEEPLARVVARNLDMNEIPFSPFWITVPLGLLMFGYFVYWKVNDHSKKSAAAPLGLKPITRAGEETDNDRWHNQREAPLRIEFSPDGNFKHIGAEEGHGIGTGRQQVYRVAVHNTTSADIVGVQIWLTDIQPMPTELRGQGALPLHVTHEGPGVNVLNLARGQKRFVDVVSYFDRFWNPLISIKHTSSAAKTDIYKGDDGYEIDLMAKGDSIRPFKRRFKIGVEDKELYMRSLSQTEQEAFDEVAENYSNDSSQ